MAVRLFQYKLKLFAIKDWEITYEVLLVAELHVTLGAGEAARLGRVRVLQHVTPQISRLQQGRRRRCSQTTGA